MQRRDSLQVGVRTIKKDFIFIVLLSSFLPFLISLLFLCLILKDSYEKIDLANSQIQHTQELEILDSLHKSMSQVYQVSQSFEIHQYFSAKSESEAYYSKKLKQYLSTAEKNIPYDNVRWIIFGGRGNILLSSNDKKTIKIYDKLKIEGAFLDITDNNILFSTPLFYNSLNSKEQYKNIYAYVGLEIPVSSIKEKYKYLKKITQISPNLSAVSFKTEFSHPSQHGYVVYLFYFYIIIFVIFNLFAVYFGIKLLQEKIINKLKLLTLRVTNEIIHFSNNEFKDFFPSAPSQNEIDSLSLTFNKYFKYVQFLQHEIEKSSQLAAVGNIAHSLAHDIRKPFSNTLLFLEQVEKIQSLTSIAMLTQEYKQVLQNSIQYVEHLLNEIMEAGVSRLNIRDNVQIEEVISRSLQNIIKLPDFCKVEIEYKILLKRFLKVDELRIIRIFSNLILNSLEAMNFQGKIWIYASENPISETAEIVIGNTNSYIEPLDIKYLFEPFYTKNKNHGTGLGLAIAQKIIQMHGGTISCRADKTKGVEFILTLPLSEVCYTPNVDRLKTSLEMDGSRQVLLNPAEGQQEKVVNLHMGRIIIVDDDPFIGRSWKRMAIDAEVFSFLYPHQLLSKIESDRFFLNENSIIISDFNFGMNSKINFYEFIRELRLLFKGKIFISTDALEEELDFNFLKEFNIQKITKKTYLFQELSLITL